MTFDAARYVEQYRRALTDDVIPFWEKHSVDRESGGYFTCLGRDGSVFDTDKFVWLQARQVYTFAHLYRTHQARPEWLEMARHGAAFLRQHGADAEGRFYFALDRSGRPLVKPYSIFSDCFAALAFGELGRASDDRALLTLARSIYAGILARRADPKGAFDKRISENRPLRSLSLPMILLDLTHSLSPLLDAELARSTIDESVNDVMNVFWNEKRRVLHEHVLSDGGFSDSFDGRLLNPGHALEAMWFVMAIARARGEPMLANLAASRCLDILERGWDEKYGGIFAFLDVDGKPPQQLEWSHKLWWVQLEALVALAVAYQSTGDARFAAWFERVHDYTWSHFPDPTHGEWFGYLDRAGEVVLPLKGGKWKGCFHLPRALLRVASALSALS